MKFNLTNHILIGILASIPVYWAALFYIELVTHQEIEELAIAATIGFFGSVYVGRYFIKMLESLQRVMPNYLLWVLVVIVTGCISWLFIHADHPFIGMPSLNLLFYWLPYIILGVAVGMFIKILRLTQYRLTEAKVIAGHNQSELLLLQSQLSPHFLFNTLNNLYGISISKHEKIPPLLLKLSELLRYSVYEAKELFVPLKDEIAYINNYIDFEKIRLGERLVINTALTEFDEQIKIAPMLLIVFIENAFKHSKNTTDKNIYIDIELKTWASSVLFSVKNSYQPNEGNRLDEKYSGFGLNNALQRLALLYPGQHDLKTEQKDGMYHIMLQIKTK